MQSYNYDQINKYISDEGVDDDTRSLISDFAILWNKYEEKLFDNHHHIRSIRKTIKNRILVNESDKTIRQCSDRIDGLYDDLVSYIKGKGVVLDCNCLMDYFKINSLKRDIEGQPILDKNGNEQHYSDIDVDVLDKLINGFSRLNRLHFLLFISAKVRNNMFHGIKDLEKLSEQKELFRICNITLKTVLDMDSINSLIRNGVTINYS